MSAVLTSVDDMAQLARATTGELLEDAPLGRGDPTARQMAGQKSAQERAQTQPRLLRAHRDCARSISPSGNALGSMRPLVTCR